MSRSGSGISDPQFCRVLRRVGEDDVLAIRRPLRNAQPSIRRRLDFGLLAAGNVDQAQTNMMRRMVTSIGGRVDPQSTNAEHGLGKIGDWRVPKTVDNQYAVMGWANDGRRRRGRLEYIGNNLRRLLVMEARGLSTLGNVGSEGSNAKTAKQDREVAQKG